MTGVSEILKPKSKRDIFLTKIKHPTMKGGIFRPLARKQYLEEFSRSNKISKHDLKTFLRNMRRYPIGIVWLISSFMWTLGLSWLIQSIVALSHKFFWMPIKNASDSMFGFINIFWIITWFAIPIAIIIYGIVFVVRSYDYFEG